jgi:hypothetical protein
VKENGMNIFTRVFERVTRHPFLSGSALILAGSLITNVLNYAFNLIVGHLLTPAEFGEVALLMTLFMLVTAPLGSIRILLTQRIATLSRTEDADAIRSFVHLTRRVSFPESQISPHPSLNQTRTFLANTLE